MTQPNCHIESAIMGADGGWTMPLLLVEQVFPRRLEDGMCVSGLCREDGGRRPRPGLGTAVPGSSRRGELTPGPTAVPLAL